jgi:anaerobic selenocysteine-containing dehydrogenase
MTVVSRRDRRSLSLALAGLLVLVLLAWVFWFSAAAHARRDLSRARDLWESREPSSYSFDYFYCGGMCGFCPVHVTVTDGAVERATISDEGCSVGAVDDAPTIEDVFDIAADNGPGLVDRSSSVSYDARWGFPSAISFTCPPDTSDCGGGWTVSGFRDLS